MLVLYVLLILCTVAVVGVAIALFVRVRSHMKRTADNKEEAVKTGEATKF